MAAMHGGSGVARFGVAPDADFSKFHCLYPIYLDKSKTVAQGRRLPLSKAVMHPQMSEIVSAFSGLKLPVVAEARKAYSRDFLSTGRIRFLLKKADSDELINPDIPDKQTLFARLAATINAIPDRKIVDPLTQLLAPIVQNHAAMATAMNQQAAQAAASAAAATPAAAAAEEDSKKKKKGKK